MILAEVLKQQSILAFNCDDFVTYLGVVAAVRETNRPVIIQISSGEMNFWGLERFVRLVAEEKKTLPLFLNFDHCRDLVLAERIIDLGFDMIHYDGSDLLWEENLTQTARVVSMAKLKNILVEGEPEKDNTDPTKAKEFIEKTAVDLIAVFTGNRHGLNPDVPEKLNLSRLRELKASVDGKLLTLHGASGVPFDDLSICLSEKLISKININSALRKVYRQALEEGLTSYKKDKVYELMAPVVEAIKQEVIKFQTINDQV